MDPAWVVSALGQFRHAATKRQLAEGGRALVITYCPLCGTAMVFDRDVNGHRLSFGVSGLLYQSSLLMYDRQTDSLWTQIGGISIEVQMDAISQSVSVIDLGTGQPLPFVKCRKTLDTRAAAAGFIRIDAAIPPELCARSGAP
jgi:hypothetical protein